MLFRGKRSEGAHAAKHAKHSARSTRAEKRAQKTDAVPETPKPAEVKAATPQPEKPEQAEPVQPQEPAAAKAAEPVRPRKGHHILQLLAALVLLCGLAVLGLRTYADYTDTHFNVTYYRVTSSHVSEKLRIVFLSDLHLREYGEGNSELVETVQDLQPDLIILGGDLVTFPNPDYENMLELCRKLKKIAPLYGVLGNHESEIIYGGVDDQLCEKFTQAGVTILRNEDRIIQIGGNRVELIGLEGALADFYKYGASARMESLSSQYDTFRICIDHVPIAFVDYMEDAPIDLALAGHTHGGLIRLPILGRLYTAEEGLFPEYAGGEYQLDSGAPMIVGCGLGDSKNIPRIYNPPELVLIDVNWY